MVKGIVFALAAFLAAFSFAHAADTNTVSSTVIDKSVPAANAPSVVVNNNDVCVSGVSGGATTQIFGLSVGTTVRDKNCEVVKLFRLLYGGGMKVAAISLICQDARVFNAMWRAGTPCPADEGVIGDAAKEWWKNNPDQAPKDSIIYAANLTNTDHIQAWDDAQQHLSE